MNNLNPLKESPAYYKMARLTQIQQTKPALLTPVNEVAEPI